MLLRKGAEAEIVRWVGYSHDATVLEEGEGFNGSVRQGMPVGLGVCGRDERFGDGVRDWVVFDWVPKGTGSG